MPFVFAAQGEVGDRGRRDAVLGDEQHLAREQVRDRNDRLLDVGVRHEPVDRAARGALKVGAGQQELREEESAFQIDHRRLRGWCERRLHVLSLE